MRKYRLFHLYSRKSLFVSRETFFDKVVLYSRELCLPSFSSVCVARADTLPPRGLSFVMRRLDMLSGLYPGSGCLPFVFFHFSRLFICSGGFYRDFCVFSSFSLQKSVLLRTFAEKKGSFFRSQKMLFLPDAIKKNTFSGARPSDLYSFFFRFIVFWYLYLCPGDFAGVFAGFGRFLGTYFYCFGTFFHNSGAR